MNMGRMHLLLSAGSVLSISDSRIVFVSVFMALDIMKLTIIT